LFPGIRDLLLQLNWRRINFFTSNNLLAKKQDIVYNRKLQGSNLHIQGFNYFLLEKYLANRSSQQSFRGKMIKAALIAEDDAEMRSYICELLSMIAPEWEIECAVNGVTASEKVKAYSYEIILSDYDMPQMNGIELFLSLKKTGYKGKFFLMSGHRLDKSLVSKLGMDGFLSKPFSTATLKKIFKKRSL
jgi:two-component system chemotaxis response regulator CheY